MVFDAKDINTITDSYTGLGETGEVMVVALRGSDTVMLLNTLRHENSSSPRELPLADASEAVQKVLSGESGVIEESEDYLGEKVWAATRYLPDFKWGIVVKINATEEELRAESLADSMFDIGIALSAFAIIGGILLGFYFAQPVRDLAVLISRIRQGETELRSPIKGDDELAYLSESLNELLEHMQGVGPPEDTSHDV